MKISNDYTVLIDGYNVIHRCPQWRRLPLQEARSSLTHLLARFRWPDSPCRVTVVFDGPTADTLAHDRGETPVTIHFAAPSADAYMQSAIRTCSKPRRLAVITDDREILQTAKAHGVARYSCEWLLGRSPAWTGGHTASPRSAPGKPSLPLSAAQRINEELTAFWLRTPRRKSR